MATHLISLSQSTGWAQVVSFKTNKAIAEFEPEPNGGGALYKAQDWCKAKGISYM